MSVEYVTEVDAALADQLIPTWIAAFGGTPAEWRRYVELLGLRAHRAARRDGRAVGGLALYETAQWFGGRAVPCAGLAAVAIAPEARRSGVARALLGAAFAELRARGVALCALYPSNDGLYRALGCEHAGAWVRYAQPLRLVGGGERELPVSPLDPLDPAALRALHRARAADEQGLLERDHALWARVVQAELGFVRAYRVGPREAPEGYLVLRQASKDALHVTDVVARTGRAARRLWTLLGDHASTVREVEWSGPPFDPWLLSLPDQDARVLAAKAWLLRILDVEVALRARGWPPGAAGELELEVEDPLLPENAGRWRLIVADGAARVERGGQGALRLQVGALAPLYSGHLTPARLAAAGRLEGSPAALATAARLFAGPRPWMPDRF